MQLIHSRLPASTSPVTMPNDGCSVCMPATGSPLSGSNAAAHTSGLIWGCSRSGSFHSSLRSAGERGANHSAAAMTGETIATQMRPSAPVEMLSGWSGRLAGDGAGLWTGEPVLRQPTSLCLGEYQRRPVRRRSHAIREVQPGHDGQYCAVGIAPEQAAAGSRFKYRALEVRVGERARRLSEIDCAVGCFSNIRAELQVPPVNLFDQCLELAATGVHRQQSSRTVAHQQAPVAGDGKAQRSSTGVADDSGLTVGRDPHDAPVVDSGLDVSVGVDYDILWRIARNRDDGQLGRSEVRQRVDRRWLPADGVDGWLRRRSHAASLAETVFQQNFGCRNTVSRQRGLEQTARFAQYAVQDLVDGVEFLLPADQRRRQLHDWVAAVIGAAVQAGLEDRRGQEAAE